MGIGNTPIHELRVRLGESLRSVFLKLEARNPCGSSKDRTALSMITEAETTGRLHHGDIVVESTSGNLGVALAYVCSRKHYEFLAVVDPKATRENLERMRRLGASIDLVSDCDAMGGYLSARIARVKEHCSHSAAYKWLNQYENRANPLAHSSTTAPEIFNQMRGRVDAVFVAVSTGGTLAGISEYTRRVSAGTVLIAVDAVGSVALGGCASARRLTGIGSSQRSVFLERCSYDHAYWIHDAEAFSFCRAIAAATDIMLGGSSGAVLAACVDYLREHPGVARPVCICPDDGRHYQSTIYNDEWLRSADTSLCLPPDCRIESHRSTTPEQRPDASS